jgi:hypothetical protein
MILLCGALAPAEAQPLERVGADKLDAGQIQTLTRAVETLQRRGLMDPTSWLYQANVHHTPSCTHNGVALPGCVTNPGDRGTYPPAARLTWSVCPHGDPMFLSWHRLYVYYMERLLRQASGNSRFTLPYWDYSHTEPGPRQLPVFLRQPPSNNPLFVRERSSLRCWLGDRDYFLEPVNAGEPVSARAASYRDAFETASWATFSSRVESYPHNQMHVSLGGFFEGECPPIPIFTCTNQKCGWMASIATAGRDTVFWLHHANIDRLWNRWLSRPGHQNPSVDQALRLAWGSESRACNQPWNGRPYLQQMCCLQGYDNLETCSNRPVFTFFDATANGQARRIDLSPRQLLATSFAPTARALGYVYDDDSREDSAVAAAALAVTPLSASAEGKTQKLGNQPRRFSLAVDDATSGKLRSALASVVDSEEGYQEILLRIAGIRSLGEGPPVGSYDVFLNLPAQANLDDAELWKSAADHYVGALTFFGLTGGHGGGEHGGHELSFLTGITDQVVAQKLAGTWQEPVVITLLPRGPHPEEPAIEFSRVEVLFE